MYSPNAEPSLDEMLDDPIVLLRIQGARLQADDVRACIKHAQERLHDRDTAKSDADATEQPSRGEVGI